MPEWSPSPKMRRSVAAAERRLIEHFDEHLKKFNESESGPGRFGGPSLYFHFQCASLYHGVPVVTKIIDDRFLEYVYATLGGWGMHRAGNSPTKLVDFDTFRASIASHAELLESLDGVELASLAGEDAGARVPELFELVDNLEVSASRARLVANTKVLHHVLPRLVVPVDRRYTLAFFGLPTDLPSTNPASATLRVLLPVFARVAEAVGPTVGRLVALSQTNWHTSTTKVIDNAIIGGMYGPEPRSGDNNASRVSGA
jgi:hypothetical protein